MNVGAKQYLKPEDDPGFSSYGRGSFTVKVVSGS